MSGRDLAGFSGSAEWFRHPLVRSVLYTEGARYVFETAGAYWLLDKIATVGASLKGEPWQAWTLKVDAKTLTADDGNGRILHTETLDYTDFPEPGVVLWMVDRTIMLPSEY